MTQELKVILSISLIALILILGGTFLLNATDNTKASSVSADPTILIHNVKHKTPADSAKVTIVEFADFQCPACGRAHPVLKQILADYKGKVTLFYRHFPLPQHQNAKLAILAAESAGEQGKFWEMHDLLYERQSEWSEDSAAFDLFVGYARELHLSTSEFSQKISSSTYDEVIQTDINDGVRLGINSTPTLFINNKKLEDAPTYQNIKIAVEEALEK